jgi:hypothetical protein
MLFATLTMLNHPNPHENILLPYMHPNLAQLSRVWIAQTILTGEPTFPCEPQNMSPNSMIFHLEARSQASSVILWDSQQNASANDLTTKSPDETKNVNKLADISSISPSTQVTNCFKKPSETNSRNLSSRRKSGSKVVTSSEIQSSKELPRGSESNRGENLNQKNNTKKKSRGKMSQKVQQPVRQYKPNKTTLFDYIQPKITDYFTDRNEHESHRVNGNKNKKSVKDITKENSNVSEIKISFKERSSQSTGDRQHLSTPTQIHTQPQTSEGRNTNQAFDSKIFSGTHGHALEEIDSQSTLRIVLQNPNGLNPKRYLVFLTCMRTCEAIGAGLICFSETNFNWRVKHLTSMMTNTIRKVWRTTAVQMSHHNETFKSSYQPGGLLP